MGHESIVHGYIVENEFASRLNRKIIQNYPFDKVYPFTNIFWTRSRARYFFPVIGITGSYNQIELEWDEWVYKFTQFLSHLDAWSAVVNLDCLYGKFRWQFEPVGNFHISGPRCTRGEKWGMTEAPKNDFLPSQGGKYADRIERWLDWKRIGGDES